MPLPDEHSYAIAAAVAIVGIAIAFFFLKGRGPKARKGFLEKERKEAPLIAKQILSHDTRVFRFGLPSDQVLGLPIGQHVFLAIPDINQSRPYTPITLDAEAVGYFELCIKIYPAGKVTQALEQLRIGDKVQLRGPMGKLHFLGHGNWTLRNERQAPVKHLAMIAGGTGITPMFQVMKAIATDPSDRTQVSLLYANQTPEDILLRPQLEELAKARNFSIAYTVDRNAPPNWKDTPNRFVGFINADMIKATLPPPSSDVLVLMCGPPPMLERACKPALAQLGYSEKLIETF